MYIFLKFVSWKFQFFPRNWLLFFGRLLGSFFYYIIPLRKSVALKNIYIAFPNWNMAEKKSLLHSCYRHYGMVLVEWKLYRYVIVMLVLRWRELHSSFLRVK